MTHTLPTHRTLPRTVRLLAALLPFLLATSAACPRTPRQHA